MEWKSEDSVAAAIVTGMALLLAKALGWLRFLSTDRMGVKKIETEIEVDLAEVEIKKTESNLKILDKALQWASQMSLELEKANKRDEQRQVENDGLRETIHTMREDFNKSIHAMRDEFDKKIAELEQALEAANKNLILERAEKSKLIKQLNEYINGTVEGDDNGAGEK